MGTSHNKPKSKSKSKKSVFLRKSKIGIFACFSAQTYNSFRGTVDVLIVGSAGQQAVGLRHSGPIGTPGFYFFTNPIHWVGSGGGGVYRARDP